MRHFRICSLWALCALLTVLPLQAETLSLDGTWTLDYWPQGRTPVVSPEGMDGIRFETVRATVPGNVELDLLAAGLIENPETGSNVYLLRPYEGYQWRYSRHFTTPAHTEEDDLFLHFGGIDCFAEVYLNGRHVGSAANMLVEHRFDVTDAVAPAGSDNVLEVYIRSSVIEGRKRIPPTISFNFAQVESVFARRAPHTYGWDIMPRLVSAGLWRGVSLEVKPPVHIVDAHWYTCEVDVAAKRALLHMDWTVTLPVKYQDGKMIAEVSLARNGKDCIRYTRKITSHAGRERFGVEDVAFWWPRGYGEPALYDATLRILDGQGNEVDACRKKIGIRTVRLDLTGTHSEQKPGRFCFYVNGEKIYIHGSNWTPLDAFHSRDPQHLEKAFAIAEDLNCNMLRCWGGNVYEDHAFFDLCDAAGILVWQDFAMGCTLYPQDDAFQQAIADEVRQVVVKLRSHPSIALWSGNNENDQTLTIGTLQHFRLDPNDDVVSRVTIPRALFETDPTRPYLPSSPYWSEELVSTSYSTADLPEDHLWGPRGYYKDAYYAEATNCFVSEIGYHGCPNLESLRRMMSPDAVYPWTGDFQWNDEWLTKSVRRFPGLGNTHERNDLMLNQVRIVFGSVPTQLEDFIFASQSVQAEAMKFFVERWRGRKFAGSDGIIWWNLRDGWPIISDAVTDYYNSKKMAYYYIRNAQRDVCCMVCETGDERRLTVVNDTPDDQSGTVRLTDRATGGLVYEGAFSVKANAAETIAILPPVDGQGVYLIEYSVGNATFLNHYLYGKPPYRLEDYKGWMEGIAPV